MSVGIKIHHSELKNCKLVIHHPGDENAGRKPKDYIVSIDSEGNSIVSETVWMRLQQARDSGASPHTFIITGEIENPPPLTIAPGTTDDTQYYKQMKDAVEQIAPPGTTPRIGNH